MKIDVTQFVTDHRTIVHICYMTHSNAKLVKSINYEVEKSHVVTNVISFC